MARRREPTSDHTVQRSSTLSGPSYRDNEFELTTDGEGLDRSGRSNHHDPSLVISPSLTAEAGISDLTFYSIEPVHDGGNALHTEWEQSQLNSRYFHDTSGMDRAVGPNSNNTQRKQSASQVSLDLAEDAYSARFSKGPETKAARPSDVGSMTDLAYNETWTDSGYASRGKHTAPTSLGDSSPKQQRTEPEFHRQYDDDEDEVATVYSVATSVPEDDLETYKSELSEAIIKAVLPHVSDAEQLESLTSLLPNLLQSFALRLGCPGSSKAEKEIMYFVHKHRTSVGPLLVHNITPTLMIS